MFERFKAWLQRQLSVPEKVAANAHPTGAVGQFDHENVQNVVPYDENLLERSRTQWQFGDWESLAKLERDTLQHHPDRAKLALLAAAGHLQQGDSQAARLFTRLAQDWGCSKKLISQILISGVHNSLGRAAAIGNQQHRTLQHFEKAIAIGTPGSDAKLLTQARTGAQLSQLGLPTPEGYIRVGAGDAMPAPKLPQLSQNIEALAATLKQQKAELEAQHKKQNDTLIDLRKHIDSKLKAEMLNATQQIEAFLDIQSFFNNGERLPSMHGWPISPDFARYLIQLLERNDFDLILEFGSGTSTVLIAKALATLHRERHGRPAVVQVAFEHLEKYHAQTLADLESVGLASSVELNLAPLQPYKAPNGQTYSYYACQQILAGLAASLPASTNKMLIVVDGPPASTGKHARYPCLPAVLAHFKHQYLEILLDDYARADEKEVGALWEQDLKQIGYQVTIEKISMEKDALLVTAIPQ
jgi:hypothetical protein